jgi:hypothetical protein
MTWLINNNFDLYPSNGIKKKLEINNDLTYAQLDWFLKRLRKKKKAFKPTFNNFSFEVEQILLNFVECYGKNPTPKDISYLTKLTFRSDFDVSEWFKQFKK